MARSRERLPRDLLQPLPRREERPPAVRPLLVYGVTDAGSVVEVRGTKGEELEVRVDGALTERVVAVKDLSSVTPPLTFRVDGIEAHETFTASAEALDALADFLDDDGRPPPWDHASELLADGLIDTLFGVTPHGRRALASRRIDQG